MNRTFYINIIRSFIGFLCLWSGGTLADLFVLILSIFSFTYGCYELKHIDELRIFKNQPFCYSDFVVSFDLLFPIALMALLVVRKMGM